jgi:hypothetical protein
MKDGTAPKGGPGNLRRLHPNKRPRRCPTCQAYLSPLCPLCLGQPDPTVSIEQLASAAASVDRAIRRQSAR